MNRDMRQDASSAISNGSQRSNNGSSLGSHTNGFSKSANGHSSPSNGSPSSNHMNGLGSASDKERSPTYFGHDREEVTRLLLQGLWDLGYESAAEKLRQESGYEVESPTVSAFRSAIEQGEWRDAELLLFGHSVEPDGGGVSIGNGHSDHQQGLRLSDNADECLMRFHLREQKYLELLENQKTGEALMVLRTELAPLNCNISRLSVLSDSPEDLRSTAGWDGAVGQSRQKLLQDLSKSISPSAMIPEHRLAVLLDQWKKSQIAGCLYHNPTTLPSLFTDHMCDRDQFPLLTSVKLDQSQGEVWFVEFSHNGKFLAFGGEDGNVIIYETRNPIAPSIQHKIRETIGQIVTVAWSPDDSKLIVCGTEHQANVYETKTWGVVCNIDHQDQPVTAAAWSPDGLSFITGSLNLKQQLRLWNLKDGHPIYTWQLAYRVRDCAISPDGQKMVTISSEQQIFVYNFVTREEEYSLVFETKMTCVSISRDSKYMLISMANSEIRLIEIETADIIRRFLGHSQNKFIIRSSFGGADENLVVSGSEDAKVYIWHKENGTLIETLEGHDPLEDDDENGAVNAVKWNPTDPGMFASCGDDKVVRLWTKSTEPRSTRRRPSSHASSYHF